MALHEEMNTAKSAIEQRIEKLRIRETQELASATGTEISARQTLSNLENHRQEVQQQLDQYGQISLMSLLLLILSGGQDHWQRRMGSYLWLIVFSILGIASIVILIATLI